jgi:hypothetical protein
MFAAVSPKNEWVSAFFTIQADGVAIRFGVVEFGFRQAIVLQSAKMIAGPRRPVPVGALPISVPYPGLATRADSPLEALPAI